MTSSSCTRCPDMRGGIRSAERLEGAQNTIGARIDADRGQVAPIDDAARVHNKQGALSNTILVAIRPITARNRSLWLEVGKQRNCDVLVLPKRGMAPGAIY